MRFRISIAVLFALAFAPVDGVAQECRRGPAPPLDVLFPDEVAGLHREFYDARGGQVSNLYRPDAIAVALQDKPMWLAVTIGTHADPFLGFSAEGMRMHYERAGSTVYEVADWPVTVTPSKVGHAFITLKGDHRVTVVVKDAIDSYVGWKLAEAAFELILPTILIPCQT